MTGSKFDAEANSAAKGVKVVTLCYRRMLSELDQLRTIGSTVGTQVNVRTSHMILAAILGVFARPVPNGAASAEQPKPEAAFRVITYNVWYGFTKTPQRKAKWLHWMKRARPDVVCLQELNGYTKDQLGKDSASWGHEHSELLKEDGFSTGITSRSPITDVKRFREGFHHGLMRVRTADCYIYVVHLHPSNWNTRIREAKLLLSDAKSLAKGSRVILAGDFNAFSPHDATHYAQLKDMEPFFARRDRRFNEKNLRDGRLDFAPIELILKAGFVDQEARFRKSFSGTFPTQIEKKGEHGDQRRLDYLFTDSNLSSSVIHATSVLDKDTHRLSDHYPVIMDIKDGRSR